MYVCMNVYTCIYVTILLILIIRVYCEEVLTIELNRIKNEVLLSPVKYASLIFDGTTWLGEVVGFLLKYWKSKSELVTVAIAYFHSDTSMDTKSLAGIFYFCFALFVSLFF